MMMAKKWTLTTEKGEQPPVDPKMFLTGLALLVLSGGLYYSHFVIHSLSETIVSEVAAAIVAILGMSLMVVSIPALAITLILGSIPVLAITCIVALILHMNGVIK